MLICNRWLLRAHFEPWQDGAEMQRLQALTLAAQEDLLQWDIAKRRREKCLTSLRHWRYVTLTMKHLFIILPSVRTQQLMRRCFDRIAASQFRQTKTPIVARGCAHYRHRLRPAFDAWKAHLIYATKLRGMEKNFASKCRQCVLLTLLTEWYRFSAAIHGELSTQHLTAI